VGSAPPNAEKDVEPQELSFLAAGNEKWYGHCGRQFRGFFKN